MRHNVVYKGDSRKYILEIYTNRLVYVDGICVGELISHDDVSVQYKIVSKEKNINGQLVRCYILND